MVHLLITVDRNQNQNRNRTQQTTPNLKIHISNDLVNNNNNNNNSNRGGGLVIPDPAHFKDQLKEVKVI